MSRTASSDSSKHIDSANFGFSDGFVPKVVDVQPQKVSAGTVVKVTLSNVLLPGLSDAFKQPKDVDALVVRGRSADAPADTLGDEAMEVLYKFNAAGVLTEYVTGRDQGGVDDSKDPEMVTAMNATEMGMAVIAGGDDDM